MADAVIRIVLHSALLVAAAAAALPAQQETRSPLDSARNVYRAELILLRDSVALVTAAGFRVRRNMSQAADETLQAQARRLRERCTSVRAVLADRRSVFNPERALDTLRAGVVEFRSAIDRLRRDLRTRCQSWITDERLSAQADSLRAWGPYRLRELDQAIAAYHVAVADFARNAGFRLPPRPPR